ncbi:MAG: nucleotidyl transferase AbiEii/AbiGii toxin family protein [Endomicrobiaceae bacterium]
MLECLLIRIANSKYKNNLILKGGFLLSIIAGLNSRTTMDIDTTLKRVKLTENKVADIFENICNIDLKDNISYEIESISNIRKDDEYGGIRVSLKANYDGLSVYLSVDVTTGDKITPCAVDFSFNTFFNNTKINILAYNTETLLSEKIETIISRSIANTRIRDFYDVYIILQTLSIDEEIFYKALIATCKKRNSLENIKNYKIVLKQLRQENEIVKLWIQYQKKFNYAKNISLSEIFNVMEKYLDNYFLKSI